MNQNQWKNELKKYLYLLPLKEERDILDYYDELFSDYYDQGLSEEEIVEQLGSPKEVAKKLVGEFIEDNDDIEKTEKERRDGEETSSLKAKRYAVKVKNGFVKAGDSITDLCRNLSTSRRKTRAKLDPEELRSYEEELRQNQEEALRRAEAERLKAEEAAEEARAQTLAARQKTLEVKKMLADERQLQKEEERPMEAYKYEGTVVRDGKKKKIYCKLDEDEEELEERAKSARHIVIEDRGPVKTKYYTLSERRSFLANFCYLLFMFIFFLCGLALMAWGFGSIIAEVFTAISDLSGLDFAIAGNLARLGYIILLLSADALFFGIGLAIFVGVIKKIHRRFFVKKFIMSKSR